MNLIKQNGKLIQGATSLLISLVIFLFLFSCNNNKPQSEIDDFIEINNNQIHVKVIGDGNELILLHGGYLNLDMWEPQIEEFKSNYKLIRYSDIGHGLTKSGGGEINGHEIIHELSTKYTDGNFSIIGLSWGAMTAVEYAIKYPKNVDQLILVSPGLNGWDYFQDSLAGVNNQLRQKATKENDTIKAIELFHQNWVIGPRRTKKELNKKFHQQSYQLIEHTMKNHWDEDWSTLELTETIKQLQDIKIPTYIIIGSEDAKDILEIGKIYDEQISDSKLIIMENVAHLLNMESSEQFNKILNDILMKNNINTN